MEVAILIYDGLTTLDAVGPYEVLWRIPGAEVKFVALERGPKRDDNDGLSLVADHALDEVDRPEILLVPGGQAARQVMHDEPTLEWVRAVHEHSRWTTSVCTGSLILGGAGLLEGIRATTHWLSLPMLAELGAEPTTDRVVEEGKIMMAAGVSSGIDMALTLAGRIAGERVAQAIQLSIEYDPQPPFDAGSPDKAPPEIVEALRKRAKGKDPI